MSEISKPLDAVLKNMVRWRVPNYRETFHLPFAEVLLDVDLSTASPATDIVLADADPPKCGLTTFDFQSGHDDFIDD